MAVKTQCPSCQEIYTLAETLVGKSVRCKECDAVFEVQPLASLSKNGVQAGIPPALKARKREMDSADEEYDEAPRRRRKLRRQREKSSAALWVVGIVGGLVGFVVAYVLVRALLSPALQVPQVGVAKDVPKGLQPEANLPVANPPVKEQNPPVNPGVNPANNQGVDEGPPGLYGDQGGDEIAPADPRLPDTILRARAEDTFFRLANPRIGQPGFGPGQALLVDYQVVRRGKHGGGGLVIHGGDGRRTNVSLFIFGQQDRGTIEVKTFGPFGSFPKNAELYMTRGDGRYGMFAPTFKVSNSVTMGVMPITTKARNWTKEEIDRYTKEPPNFTAFNVHTGVGQDTPFVGDTTGGGLLRYVEPKGHLLGLEFRLSEWEMEKCVGGLTPIFARDQPVTLPQRVLAKEGYAVAGAEVHTGKFVDGIKLLFQRLKADGTLDPADAYASEWIGFPGGGPARKLADNGRRVIGIHLRQGAILNGMALVTGDLLPQ